MSLTMRFWRTFPGVIFFPTASSRLVPYHVWNWFEPLRVKVIFCTSWMRRASSTTWTTSPFDPYLQSFSILVPPQRRHSCDSVE